MYWREHLAENLPDYFKIFVSLVVSASLFVFWVSMERFASLWAVLVLFIFFLGLSKLHELIPKAGGAFAIHSLYVFVSAVAAGIAYGPIQHLGEVLAGNVLVALCIFLYSSFLTLMISLAVYDECLKCPHSSRSFNNNNKRPV